MKTLIITLCDVAIDPNSTIKRDITYERLFTSKEDFIEEFSEQLNQSCGAEGWFVSEKE